VCVAREWLLLVDKYLCSDAKNNKLFGMCLSILKAKISRENAS
jgi:hypothetical protein